VDAFAEREKHEAQLVSTQFELSPDTGRV